jgi:O-methyltransferase involved in polyketide biosynthesis
VKAEKKNPMIDDPMAILCYEKLPAVASEKEKRWMVRTKKMFEGILSYDINPLIKRISYFDRVTSDYISTHPNCAVVSLACGFDTRFWRIQQKDCSYIELDLPEVIALKKEILKEHINYELIGCSVLDHSWIDRVTEKGNSNILIIAEGIFMYLPKEEVISLFQIISQRLTDSQITMEMADEKYTKGLMKRITTWYFKKFYGLDVTYLFGITKPHDFEGYADGFKIIDIGKGSVGPLITASINDLT